MQKCAVPWTFPWLKSRAAVSSKARVVAMLAYMSRSFSMGIFKATP